MIRKAFVANFCYKRATIYVAALLTGTLWMFLALVVLLQVVVIVIIGWLALFLMA